MATLTVYTKLLDQTLDGGRIIDFGTTKSCECYVIPRDKTTDICKKHSRLQQYGFYMLLGHDKNMKPMVYVGQTNDFTNRVNDHKQKKDWWDTALVFVSKLGGIYASEALYLEYLGWKAVKEADNYIVENTKDINEPQLSEQKKDEMETFFEDIQFLTRFYGCQVFDEPKKMVTKADGIDFKMTMSKTGVDAKMKFYKDSNTYVILAGSKIFSDTSSSCNKGIAEYRKQVIANKKLSQKSGNLYELLQDVEIPEKSSSPSGAASFCAGTARQGTDDWVDNNNNKYPSSWWKNLSVII